VLPKCRCCTLTPVLEGQVPSVSGAWQLHCTEYGQYTAAAARCQWKGLGVGGRLRQLPHPSSSHQILQLSLGMPPLLIDGDRGFPILVPSSVASLEIGGAAAHMELDDQLRGMAQSSGVNFFGVADLSVARDAILEQGGSALASFPRAISIGITLLHRSSDELQVPRLHSRESAARFHHLPAEQCGIEQGLQSAAGTCFPDCGLGATPEGVLKQAGGAPGRFGLDRQELPAGHT